MSISDIRYLIADIFQGQLGSFSDKINTPGFLRVVPTDNNQAVAILKHIGNLPGITFFQGYGLDEENNQVIFHFGGSSSYLRKALETLNEKGVYDPP